MGGSGSFNKMKFVGDAHFTFRKQSLYQFKKDKFKLNFRRLSGCLTLLNQIRKFCKQFYSVYEAVNSNISSVELLTLRKNRART